VDSTPKPSTRLSQEALRRFVPLDSLGPRSLQYILEHTRVLTLAHSAVLFEIGDTAPFTYYLLRGAITLDSQGGSRVVKSGSEEGRYALGNLLPRRFRACIASPRALVARMDRDLLEKEVAWGQLPKPPKKGQKVEDNEWRIDLLRTPAFARLPMANVQKLFEVLEELPCQAGQVVIREGDPGDFYYIIRSGRCRVVRTVRGSS